MQLGICITMSLEKEPLGTGVLCDAGRDYS